ncbi:flavin reductase [bacterium SCSIO 12643]|nr:flavin reductase [bacterium SCSIO 12643]
MHFTKSDIEYLDHVRRLNIMNSISGIKSVNMIGTVSQDGVPNLAVFSSVVHLGSSPALMGFILRPKHEVIRDTYENIKETGMFTINHVHQGIIKQSHYTSAKFEADVSEFEMCNLNEEYLEGFKAPFVLESRIKIGLSFKEEIDIKSNQTTLIVGEVAHLMIPNEAVAANGYVDLEMTQNVGVSGLNRYYALNRMMDLPYARPHQLPKWE